MRFLNLALILPKVHVELSYEGLSHYVGTFEVATYQLLALLVLIMKVCIHTSFLF